MLKHTPLFEEHKQLGGRMVEFGGWEMPVQYTSIVEEHQAVRSAGGLFDISHMGEIIIHGAAATEFLNHTLTNDIRKIAVGQGQYTLMCHDSGGVMDDLYVYHIAGEEYLLIVNASRVEKDIAWLKRQLAAFPKRGSVHLQNVSEHAAAIAVQGPKVVEFIDTCFHGGSTGGAVVGAPSNLRKNQIAQFLFSGQPAWVARTGYTGEDGFEVAAPAGMIAQIWKTLLATGKASGLVPAGLGARDTLRTEVCYPLYGHELDEQTTPMEAGLSTFVALDKGEFVGRTILAQQKMAGVVRKCMAFKMTEKSAPPRPHYTIWTPGKDGQFIGEVVSGTQSPTLGIGIGMGYVKAEFARPSTSLAIEIRGSRAPAIVVQKPFYRKPV